MIDSSVLNATCTTTRPLALYKTIAKTLEKYRGDDQKWTLQRNWQHRTHKTKKNKTKTQHNINKNHLIKV